MGSLTNYAENLLLNHIFNASQSAPSNIYLALCTASPGEAATGASMNEVADANGYARTLIAFDAAASRQVNGQLVTFPAVTGAGYSNTHWALVDSVTHGAGNVLAYGGMSQTYNWVSGNTPRVAAGQVYVNIPASNGVSNYLANAVLDWLLRGQALTAPDTYVGYTTAVPTDASTGSTITEPAGGGYAREQVNPNGGSSPTWTTVASGALDNLHQVDFTQATGSQGTIVSMVICDAVTAGNLLFYGDITDQVVASGTDVNFPVGTLDVNWS